MSRVAELIKQLSPDGVEHILLSAVAAYSTTRVHASELDETSFVGVDNLVAHKGGRVDANYLPNTARLTAYKAGDVLLGNIRPYLKKVWLATNNGGCSGDVLAIRINKNAVHRLTPTFLYYLLSSDEFFAFNMRHARGAKMPRGDKAAILKYRIPIPPLEVQREIVRILNTFSALEAELETELETELEARHQQYEHYRHELLAPVGKHPVHQLHEVADFINAKAHEKLVHPDGTVALMTARFISRGIADRYVLPEDVLTPAISGDVALVMSDLPNGRALARTFYVDEDQKYAANQRVCLLRSKDFELLSPRYLYYIMNRNKQLLRYDSGFDQTHLKKDYILKVKLEIPPIQEQNRIVGILDKFDALVNALSDDLPAELAARREQYEYYRDKLLTFKKLEVAA